MTVGMPGTGIAAVFYILLVIFMPIAEAWRTIRGRSSVRRWGVVAMQNVIVWSIVGLMWLQGLLLGAIFLPSTATPPAASGTASSTIDTATTGIDLSRNILRVDMLIWTVGTFVLLWSAVFVASLVVRGLGTESAASGHATTGTLVGSSGSSPASI